MQSAVQIFLCRSGYVELLRQLELKEQQQLHEEEKELGGGEEELYSV